MSIKRSCRSGLYAALAERSFSQRRIVKTTQSWLYTQGHPDMKVTPGLDMTTGSLDPGFICCKWHGSFGKSWITKHTEYMS